MSEFNLALLERQAFQLGSHSIRDFIFRIMHTLYIATEICLFRFMAVDLIFMPA